MVSADLEFLWQRCEEWLPHRFGRETRDAARERLQREFSLIARHGHEPAFQLAAAIGRYTLSTDIPCRLIGSGSCSLVGFLLGLSPVDPLRHHLPAERFLSLHPLTFLFVVDARQADHIRRFAVERGNGERHVIIHSGTEREMIPEQVARILRRNHDPAFDLRSLPLNDQRTGAQFGTGELYEFFPFPTDDFCHALRRLKPRSIEEFTALMTAAQIGIQHDGMLDQFLERTNSTTSALQQPVEMTRLLAETHGLLLYQEHVMLLLRQIGDIPLAAGYQFIKRVAKRHDVSEFRQRFMKAAGMKQISQQTAEELFHELERTAGFALCKAHQLAMALTIWQTMYFKTHFPHELNQAVEHLGVGSH